MQSKSKWVREFFEWVCNERTTIERQVALGRTRQRESLQVAAMAVEKGCAADFVQEFHDLLMQVALLEQDLDLFNSVYLVASARDENALDLSQPAIRLLWERFNREAR